MNPWEVTEAFEPMYVDTVGYRCVRQNNVVTDTSCPACVFPVENCDPLDDVSLETDVRKISVSIMRKDWLCSFEPQVGDVITLDDNSKWGVSRVLRQANTYSLTAKQID